MYSFCSKASANSYYSTFALRSSSLNTSILNNDVGRAAPAKKKGGKAKKVHILEEELSDEMRALIDKLDAEITEEDLELVEEAMEEIQYDPTTLTPLDGRRYYKLCNRQKIKERNLERKLKMF